MTLKTGAEFDGASYDSRRDKVRLTGHLQKLYDLMQDGQWRTLAEIESAVQFPQASISAALRCFRKEKFGGFVVDREYIRNGLHKYRLDISKQMPANTNNKKAKKSDEQYAAAYQMAQMLFDELRLKPEGALIKLSPLDLAIVENLAAQAGLEK